MTAARRAGAVVAVLLLAAACGRAAATSTPPAPRPTPRPTPVPAVVDVRLTIHHSHFAPDHLALPAGATVRFTVTNTDPIDHELIVGDEATQNLHEFGTDAVHDAPGAVSVAAGTTGVTEIVVRAGFSYACHLPGHFAYGMRGTISLRR